MCQVIRVQDKIEIGKLGVLLFSDIVYRYGAWEIKLRKKS